MLRPTLLLAAILCMPSCSLTLDFDHEFPEVPCIASDTCAPDAKCAIKINAGNVPRLACALTGDVPALGRCTEATAGGPVDDCGRDHHCYRNTCYARSSDCKVNESVVTVTIDTFSFDMCIPNCDVLTAPACPAALGCYLATDRLSTAGLCHAVGATALLQPCTRDVDCASKHECPTGQNICTALCPPPNNQYCIDGNFGTVCSRDGNDAVGECTP